MAPSPAKAMLASRLLLGRALPASQALLGSLVLPPGSHVAPGSHMPAGIHVPAGSHVAPIHSSSVPRARDEKSGDPVAEINKEFQSVFGDDVAVRDPTSSVAFRAPPHDDDPFAVLPTEPPSSHQQWSTVQSATFYSRTDPNYNSNSNTNNGTVPHLTHVDSQGKVSMVDVSGKLPSARVARASSQVVLGPVAFRQVAENLVKKGDVLATARIAGIGGAKETSRLIPLCHSIPLSHVRIDVYLDSAHHSVKIQAEASTVAATGVEMEAMTAASVAALTVYDMCKALDKGIVIKDVRLEAKSGGKSGTWIRQP